LISLDRKKGLGSVFFSGTPRVPEKRLSRPFYHTVAPSRR